MPVDLSDIGLKGIRAGQDTLDQIEQRKVSTLARQATQIEMDTKAKEEALSMEASRRISELAGGGYRSPSSLFSGVDENSSLATPLEITADVFMRGGAPKQGMDYLKAASQISKDESTIRKQELDGKKVKLETVLKTADVVSRTIGVAQNDSEWRWGLRQLREQEALPPEMLDQLDAMDFDPEVAEYLNQQAISAAARANMDMTATQRDFTNRNTTERTRLAVLSQENSDARLELARQAANRQDKAGSSASAPNNQELSSVTAAVISQVYEGTAPKKGDPALQAGAASIASRAKQLVKDDKSINWQTAVNRAIIESQSNGEWGDRLEEKSLGTSLFGRDVDGKNFDGTGRTLDEAIPMPMTKAGAPDVSKLKKGRYYITAQGPGRFTGEGFEVAE